jgi:hypothetical protein
MAVQPSWRGAREIEHTGALGHVIARMSDTLDDPARDQDPCLLAHRGAASVKQACAGQPEPAFGGRRGSQQRWVTVGHAGKYAALRKSLPERLAPRVTA